MSQNPNWTDDYLAKQWQRFGAEVKRRRKQLGYTQEEAAEKIGKKRQQWARIESGSSTTRSTVLLIAEALHWNVADALAVAGFTPLSSGLPIKPEIDAELAAVLVDFARLSDRDKSELQVLVEIMHEQITKRLRS